MTAQTTTCCAAAHDELATLRERHDQGVMELSRLQSALHRQTIAMLAQPQPLPAMRIALLADQHLRTCRTDDIQAFARAVERAHGIGRTTQGGA